MARNIRFGITFGVIFGFLTFIFGGWSIAVLGSLMGAGLGLAMQSRLTKQDSPLNLVRASLPTIGASFLTLAILSIAQNYLVEPAIGSTPVDLNIVLPANLIGILGGMLLAFIIVGLRGLPESKERNWKLMLLALFIVSYPFIDNFTGLRWMAPIIFSLIYVILGMGLNIVVGYAGLLDLGYAAFFAIGAYTTAILSSTGSVLYINSHITLNFWLVIPIAAAIAAIFGLLLGAPTLPLRGDYLAIVTLGFGEIVPVLFRNLIDVSINEPFTCVFIPWIQRLFGSASTVSCIVITSHLDLTAGEKGINPVGRPSLPFIGEFSSSNPIPWYFLIIAIILFSIFLINRLRESRLGRAWMAIREDELAAAQMGIDPVRTKLLAFAMGATFSGFAGAFYASYIAGIFPSVFEFSASIIILCVVILGGMGNIYGVIVGALVINMTDRLLLPTMKDFLTGLLNHTILPALANNPTLQAIIAQNANPTNYRWGLFGLTLVIMMAVRPEGLLPSAQRRMELHANESANAPVTAK